MGSGRPAGVMWAARRRGCQLSELIRGGPPGWWETRSRREVYRWDTGYRRATIHLAAAVRTAPGGNMCSDVSTVPGAKVAGLRIETPSRAVHCPASYLSEGEVAP